MLIRERFRSQLPVLELMKRLSHIKRILEFGTGTFSTNLLLEFPDLEMLTSYEDNKDKFDTIEKCKEGRNKKWNLVLIDTPLQWWNRLWLEEFDLVFVNCCDGYEEGPSIVAEIASGKPRPIVVVRDIDSALTAFPEIMQEFDYKMVYDQSSPTIGILWNQMYDKEWKRL